MESVDLEPEFALKALPGLVAESAVLLPRLLPRLLPGAGPLSAEPAPSDVPDAPSGPAGCPGLPREPWPPRELPAVITLAQPAVVRLVIDPSAAVGPRVMLGPS